MRETRKRICGVDMEALDRCLRERMSAHRYEHTQSVLRMALSMAKRFGENEDKTRLAALFHDYCKDSGAKDNNLLHGGQASDILREEYGVDDADVLNAVRYHTTGRKGMSRLEMIVFLADTLEPGRTYEGVEILRDLAFKDLETGVLRVLKELEVYLVKNGLAMTPDSVEAIEWLESRGKKEANG